ncbi:MAG: hypothetical protein V1772_08450, partial [Chloroflexota bacterium]
NVVAFPRAATGDARKRFVFAANDVVFRLLVQGILAPGRDESNLTLPLFHLTAYGRQVLACSGAVPYDPSGYLDNIRNVTPRPVLLAYAEEAVACFNAGCFNAAVFFLGVACESLLVEIHSSLRSARARADAPIKKKHGELLSLFTNLPNQEKDNLPETLDIQLGAIYDLVRRQRNSLGHPQSAPPAMDQKQAFSFFMVFPELVRDIEAFGQYCVQNGL